MEVKFADNDTVAYEKKRVVKAAQKEEKKKTVVETDSESESEPEPVPKKKSAPRMKQTARKSSGHKGVTGAVEDDTANKKLDVDAEVTGTPMIGRGVDSPVDASLESS